MASDPSNRFLLKGKAPVTEAQAEAAVIDLFRWHGWEVRRVREDIHNKDGQGIPDLLCTAPEGGMQLWLEIKRPASSQNPRGRVRPKQKETLTAWRLRGVECAVADGVDVALRRIAEGGGFGAYFADVLLGWCDELMEGYEWWPA